MHDTTRSGKIAVRTAQDDFQFEALKSKTNAELISEIDEMVAASSVEDLDTDKIDLYLALLQEREPIMEGFSADELWDKLRAEHPLLFEDDLDDPVEHKRGAKRSFRFSTTNIIVQIILALLLGLVVTANAFEVNPIKAFLNWADGIIQVFSNPTGVMELPADDPSDYHSLEEALARNDIPSDVCPTWVPRDYKLMSVQARTTDDIMKCSATYNSSRGVLLIRVMKFVPSDWSGFEEREEDGYIYTRDGVEYYFTNNLELSKVGWQIGDYSFVISGQLSEKELKEMIDSIS